MNRILARPKKLASKFGEVFFKYFIFLKGMIGAFDAA